MAVPVFGVDPSGSPSTSPTAVAATPGPSASPAGSPAPSSSVAASASIAPEPSGSHAPCPLPTPSPTPVPTPSPSAGASITPVPSPTITASALPHNLCPAVLNGADPISILAWLFTPIFQAIFMVMVFLYNIFGDIGIAIIVLTIILRLITFPLFRKQIVSQRRMQALQPELRAIQARYKGQRTKLSEEQMRLYRERGINPAAGCLPSLLQLALLIPMYQVISNGLQAPDITSMLQVFGTQVLHVACQAPGDITRACVNPTVTWLGWLPAASGQAGLDAHKPEIFLMVIPGVFGLSLLALVSALLQLVQTRMMTPSSATADPQQRSQQRIFLILPLFSLIYGWFLPAGLFLYWITTTLFSIIAQYVIAGYGGLFPLFGWTPSLARNHQPPPVPSFKPRVENGTSAPDVPSMRRSPTDRSAGTIRPTRSRGRTSRRGRRR